MKSVKPFAFARCWTLATQPSTLPPPSLPSPSLPSTFLCLLPLRGAHIKTTTVAQGPLICPQCAAHPFSDQPRCLRYSATAAAASVAARAANAAAAAASVAALERPRLRCLRCLIGNCGSCCFHLENGNALYMLISYANGPPKKERRRETEKKRQRCRYGQRRSQSEAAVSFGFFVVVVSFSSFVFFGRGAINFSFVSH